MLSQLPSFFLERFPQVLHAFQQEPEPVGPRLGEAAALGAQEVPRVEAVEGDNEIRAALSPVQHLRTQTRALGGREAAPTSPQPTQPSSGVFTRGPPAGPTWLSWARRSQRSRQMAVPDMVASLSRTPTALPRPVLPHPAPAAPARPIPASPPRFLSARLAGEEPSRLRPPRRFLRPEGEM